MGRKLFNADWWIKFLFLFYTQDWKIINLWIYNEKCHFLVFIVKSILCHLFNLSGYVPISSSCSKYSIISFSSQNSNVAYAIKNFDSKVLLHIDVCFYTVMNFRSNILLSDILFYSLVDIFSWKHIVRFNRKKESVVFKTML